MKINRKDIEKRIINLQQLHKELNSQIKELLNECCRLQGGIGELQMLLSKETDRTIREDQETSK